MPFVLRASAPRRRRDASPAISPARLSPLDIVALQVICGFILPLPFIQTGHWLLGWPSVSIMFGGL